MTEATFDAESLGNLVPLAATLGFVPVAASADRVELTLEYDASLCTAGGVLHGGALMALADTAGAVCAVFNLPEGSNGTTTVESKTNLLAAVRSGVVTAVATPLKAGRRFVVVETEVRDADGRLVSKTTQTQAVL
jgi:uncharacterized protein (TIGR00369 family)